MKYRRFGKTNEMVSVLGFGMMRLPLNSDDPKDINEPLATEMVRRSIDAGVNYIDTAVPYHGGMSEPFTAKVLKDGYREKVFLATKLPSWAIKSREDMDKHLNEQLEKLETEHIDFYLIHYLRKDFWKNLTENGLFDFMDSVKKDGRVKHIGFSFHDDYDTFKTILDSYEWDFCQIQLNIIDANYQAGLKGLEDARKKDLGITIMEPLRGGALVTKVPEDVMTLYKAENPSKTPVHWALDYLYDIEGVCSVLSGMSEMSHVEENLKIASESEINKLSDSEKNTLAKVKKAYDRRIKINCTECKYCMQCPQDIHIPYALDFYNSVYMFDNFEKTNKEYWDFFGDRSRAESCTACGACMTKCPQNIDIVSELQRVSELFGSKK